MFLLHRPAPATGPSALPVLADWVRAFDPKIVLAPALAGARNLASPSAQTFALSGDAAVSRRAFEFPGVNGLVDLSTVHPVDSSSRSLLLITRLAVSPSAYPAIGSMSCIGDGRVMTNFFGPAGGSYCLLYTSPSPRDS